MGQAISVLVRRFLLLGFVFISILEAQELGVPAVSSTIPFQLRSNFLVVVEGQVGELDGLKFILDTGATNTFIDQKLADRLRLRRHPGKITNFDREVAVDWAEIPDLRIGPYQAVNFRVMVAKLGKYSELAENVDGIIGLDLLGRSKKLFIDYEKRTVSWELSGDRAGGGPPPAYFTIPVVVQGFPMHLVIDTGFEVMLMYKDRLHKGVPGLRTEGDGIEVDIGRLQTTQVKVPGVRLFGAETVATVFLADGPGTGNIPGIDGYLGVASLKAKRVEFDFADRILRWR